eukprot:15457824-Alexandrium_andersonii.AAC.2
MAKEEMDKRAALLAPPRQAGTRSPGQAPQAHLSKHVPARLGGASKAARLPKSKQLRIRQKLIRTMVKVTARLARMPEGAACLATESKTHLRAASHAIAQNSIGPGGPAESQEMPSPMIVLEIAGN